METIVLEVQSNVARQFNGLSLTEKRFYFDLFERLFLNRNSIEKEGLNGSATLSILLNDISQSPTEYVKISDISDEKLKERLAFINSRTKEEHQKAVKDLMKTVEAIGLRAEERGMTDEIFEQLMKED